MSILSTMPDGCGFYYGFLPDDRRQLNITWLGREWVAYVDGELLTTRAPTKHAAELMAIEWAKANPESECDAA